MNNGLSGWLIHFERLRGCQSSACLWIFWFLLAVALAFPLRSYINLVYVLTIDERVKHVKALLFFVFYGLTIVQLFVHCFAEPPPASKSKTVTKVESDEDSNPTLKPCPEQSSSFLSRITFNWFFSLAWKGFRRPLTKDDVWDLDDCNQTANLNDAFRQNWDRLDVVDTSSHKP